MTKIIMLILHVTLEGKSDQFKRCYKYIYVCLQNTLVFDR